MAYVARGVDLVATRGEELALHRLGSGLEDFDSESSRFGQNEAKLAGRRLVGLQESVSRQAIMEPAAVTHEGRPRRLGATGHEIRIGSSQDVGVA